MPEKPQNIEPKTPPKETKEVEIDFIRQSALQKELMLIDNDAVSWLTHFFDAIDENLEKYSEDELSKIFIHCARTEPLYTLILCEWKEHLPWMRQWLLEAQKRDVAISSTKKNPFLRLEIGAAWFPVPFKAETEEISNSREVLLEWAKKLPFEAIKNYPLYQKLPFSKEIYDIACQEDNLTRVADEDPLKALLEQNTYSHLPYFKNVKNVAINSSRLQAALLKSPWHIFKTFADYQGKPWAKEMIKMAMERGSGYPDNIQNALRAMKYMTESEKENILIDYSAKYPLKTLEDIKRMPDDPQSRDIIKNIRAVAEKEAHLIEATEKNPSETIYNFSLFEHLPYAKKILLTAVSRDPILWLRRWPEKWSQEIQEQALKKEVLIDFAQRKPLDVLRNKDFFSHLPWAKEVIAKASEKNILSAAIKKEPEKWIDMFTEYRNSSDIDEICIQIFHICRLKPELYVHLVQLLNKLHEEPENQRFQIMKNANTTDIYNCITYGREEVFTSTFQWLYKRLMSKNTNIDTLFESVYYDKIHIFIECAISYWYLEDILSRLGEKKSQVLIQKLFEKISESTGSEQEQKYAITIAEIFQQLSSKNGNATLSNFGKELHKKMIEFSAEKEANKTLWNIVSRYAQDISKEGVGTQIDPLYQLNNLGKVEPESLWSDNTHIQRYYFYDDNDGKASYENFVSAHKDWKIEDKNSYITLSREISGGKKIIILANKPTSEDSGNKAIDDLHKPTHVFVHRGHSYHAYKSIERITNQSKIVFLWSCWGAQHISNVMNINPSAHIIATKGTGTMLVNEPLLNVIEGKVASWKTFDWQSIWSELGPDVQKNKNFPFYIRPDKNIGLLVLQKYKELSDKK